MRSVGLFEAKNRLSELVEAAAAGESTVITRHGRPAATLTAPPTDDRQSRVRAAMERVGEWRKLNDFRLTSEEIIAAIDEGRK